MESIYAVLFKSTAFAVLFRAPDRLYNETRQKKEEILWEKRQVTHMPLETYDGRMVCIRDTDGKTFTGEASFSGAEYNLHEYGRNDDGIQINGFLILESQIAEIRERP